MPPGIGFGFGLAWAQPVPPSGPPAALPTIQTEDGDDILAENGDPMTMES